ncbi:T9SS type A sorting domain-containing protein [Flectobacillus sp. DC10W]|uniref:T9SS type A sorting domain-containing protein n=1 Tax=Flectobacillus longus TaxID=2984207 RepID=A0ABT6YJR3_9BACT|nr:T9SS type A sorting domain-containing protein [Flectobacillus longus]MDI9863368.1 T9SS type A sorting domain-containing protein [Flectobacillus longus]
MRKFLLIQLFIFGCFLQGFSQTVTITRIVQPTSSNICSGSKFIIAYQKTGNFNSDNKFKLQFTDSYNTSKVLVDIDTKDSSGYLVGTFPDFQQIPGLSNFLYNSYNYVKIQIASTSPVVAPVLYGSYSSFTLGVRPTVKIDTSSVTISRDKALLLKLSGTSTGSASITTSEGSVHSLQSYSTNFSDYVISTYPTKSGDFFIKEVTNVCGVGTAQGKIKLTVSDNFLSISNLPSTTYCTDANINISFEKRGTWSADNKFKIRFTSTSNASQYYDVEASETGGVLSAKIPGIIPRTSFSLRILGTSPLTVSSSYSSNISIAEGTKVDIQSDSRIVRYGSVVSLNVNSSGMSPINFELSDGYNYNLNNSGYPTSIFVYPTKTQDYKIKRFTSECNTGEGVNVSKITVIDAIKVEEILTRSVCPSGVFKVRFSSQPVMEVNTPINMALQFNDGSKTALTGKVTEPGLAEFTFPSSNPNEGKTFTFGLFPNPLIGSTFEYGATRCLFKTTPKFTYSNMWSTYTIDKPSWVYASVGYSGGGTVEFEDNLGKKSTIYMPEGGNAYFNAKFYASDNMSYKLTKVSNECGISTDTKFSVDINVVNPAKTLKLSAPFGQGSAICAGTTQELTLQRIGTFDASSKYYLDYVDDSGNILQASVGEFVNDKFSWIVPSNYNTINLQVRASSPYTTSERYMVEVGEVPSYSGPNEINALVTYGNYYSSSLKLDNKLYTTAVFDNGLRVSGYGGYLGYSFDVLKSGSFIINKLTNGCSTKDVNIKINVSLADRIVEFKGNYNTTSTCAGRKLELKYAETIVRPSNRLASYKLMLLKLDGTLYSKQALLTGIKQSPFEVMLPQDIAEGNYSLKLVDESDSLIVSYNKTIVIQKAPNVSVEVVSRQNDIDISYGETFSIRVINNGQSNYEGVVRGKYGEAYPVDNYNNSYYTITPKYSNVYTLPRVSNQCGVQDLNFSLNVRVKPMVTWSVSNLSSNSNSNICRNEKLRINLTSYGDVDTTQLYKLSFMTSTTGGLVYYEIARIKPYGSYALSIPSNIPISSYQVVLQNITAPNTDIRGSWYGTLIEVPDLTIAGNVTTLVNQPVNLTLKSSNGADGYYVFSGDPTFELSNGVKGSLSSRVRQSGFLTFPAQKSETVTLKSVSNQCGVASGKGSATITVLSESDKYIWTMDPATINFYSYTCTGTETRIGFKLIGFTTSNPSLGLEMSDSLGVNFKEIETLGISYATNTISFKIPTSASSGQNYRFRVISKENGISSTTSVIPLDVVKSPTASFDTTLYYFSPEKQVDLKVKLTGNFPVSFKLGTDELNAKDFSAPTSPYTVTLNPTIPTKFRLFKVSDYYCSTGIIGSNSTVSLELVTGFEDIQKLGVTVGPNPATDFVTINTDETGIKAELVDATGNVLSELKLQSGTNQLDFKNYQNGMYLLRISKDQKVGVFKLMKF